MDVLKIMAVFGVCLAVIGCEKAADAGASAARKAVSLGNAAARKAGQVVGSGASHFIKGVGEGIDESVAEFKTEENNMNKTVYSFTVKNREGGEVSLETYRGKVLLIVNTATGCGFTPQYEGLERLYAAYHDKGLEILDFPCNQFGHQAPGSDDEIHRFCTLKYNTTFDQLAKIEVNGANAEPLFKFLKEQKPADDDPAEETAALRALLRQYNLTGAEAPGDIEWNFTKFLVDRNGNVVKRSGPKTTPAALAASLEALLSEK